MNVLVVDDSTLTQRIICHSLDSLPIFLITANNGKEALEVYKKESIDLILTDILMPEMDGVELIHNVREIDNDIPVIALDYEALYKEVIDHISEGFTAVVNSQPLDVDGLIEFVKKYIPD